MKVKTSIVALVLMFALVEGDVNEDSRVIQKPQWQFNWSQDRLFYLCQFNFIVRCMWNVNGFNIDIVAYGYAWMTGNGSNTNDCSIEAKSIHTQKLSDDRNRVECIGIGSGPRRVTIGGSVNLQCPVTNKNKCKWTRDTEAIEMYREYHFNKDHDCSLRIKNVRPVDLAEWKCFDILNAPHWPTAIYTLVEKNQIDDSRLNSSYEINATIAASAISTERTTTSLDQHNESVLIVMVATIITLSAVIIIGVVCAIRQRIKKSSRRSNGHNNRHDHDGGATETTSSTSNARTSNGHVKASTCQSETEDDDGYLVANQMSANTKPTNDTKRCDTNNPNNHAYETIKDDIYTNVGHPTGNTLTYTVLF